MDSASNPPRRAWLMHASIVLAYGALTLVMTWPLAARFSRAVLGPPGDNLEYVWKMWWFKHALLDLGASPFFAPDVFYPFGYPVALSETTVAHTVLGLPLTALWGEAAAYNAMMVFSFVLSGYGLYLYLRHLGCGAAASFIGGAIYAFCPYRMSHLGAGHLPLMGTGWVPLLLLAIERLIRRPSGGRGALVGVCYALTALSSWYYAVMVGAFAGLYLVARARPWRAMLGRARLWLGLGVAALVAGGMIAPAAWPIIKLYSEGQTTYNYALSYVDQWSASPVDFIYPNAMHPWWGAWLTTHYYQNINENLVYLGWAALALATLGLWARRREALPRTLALLAAIAFILALGTTLHVAGKPVYVRVPEAVEYQFSRAMHVLTGRLALHRVDYSPLRREGAIVLPLPTLLLYLFVPTMNAMRVWSRFGILVMLMVAALAGLGSDALLARIGTYHRWRQATAGILVGLLVLVDFAALPYPYGYTEVRGQPVDDWLAQQPAAPAIHYPLDKTWYGWMLYPVRVHGQPIAYGYGTFAPEAYRASQATLATFPSAESLALLRQWGVKYILVGARSYGAAWPEVERLLAAAPGVGPAMVFEDRPLFDGDRLLHLVRPSADVPSTELINGSYRAYLNDEIHVYTIQ